MRSGASATNSAEYLRMRSASPEPKRYSIRTLRPSVQPDCCSPLQECRDAGLTYRMVFGERHKRTDAPDLRGLLRARRERPRHGRAADKRDELLNLSQSGERPLR